LENELPDRHLLMSYLLGTLTDAERAAVAERYFADDDWLDELLDVENELLDGYARGDLNDNERAAFEAYLRRLPDGESKAAVARALLETSEAERERARQLIGSQAAPRRSRWRALLGGWTRPSGRWRLLRVAAFAVIIVGLLLALWQINRQRRETQQLSARLAASEQERARLAQAAEDEAAARKRISESQAPPKPEPPPDQTPPVRDLSPAVVTWTLTPALRATGSPDRVSLPSSARSVAITIPIESGERVRDYRVVIRTTDGQQRRDLRASRVGQAVTVKLAASYFVGTTYKLTLIGADKEAGEMARDYYFTVVKR
jgi:hypothetical protein